MLFLAHYAAAAYLLLHRKAKIVVFNAHNADWFYALNVSGQAMSKLPLGCLLIMSGHAQSATKMAKNVWSVVSVEA